ncbi:hypothetical protein ACSBR2_024459 [Camellia fascicularis]
MVLICALSLSLSLTYKIKRHQTSPCFTAIRSSHHRSPPCNVAHRHHRKSQSHITTVSPPAYIQVCVWFKMSRAASDVPLKGGFSFDLCRRDEMLSKKSVQAPKFLKTGTTIVGLIFQDGVILGVNTRATEGPIVADKNCEKIHFTAVEQALLLIQRQ